MMMDSNLLVTFKRDQLGKKICSECGAESVPARRWLPTAGGDREWAVRTGSGPMRMCGDIFAAAHCRQQTAVEGPFADDKICHQKKTCEMITPSKFCSHRQMF
jgi:hypothetical protein